MNCLKISLDSKIVFEFVMLPPNLRVKSCKIDLLKLKQLISLWNGENRGTLKL